MKVGDYVRDSEGEIAKIIKKHEIITEDNIYIDTTYYWKSLKDNCEGCFCENMSGIKSSPNIIDLIEVGDYVNGCRVEENNGLGYFIILQNGKSKWLSFKGLVIKSIVTKEQFESMEYEIGE